MEENEDEPEDVRKATPVKDEVEKGEKDEKANDEAAIAKKGGKGRCDKNLKKKNKANGKNENSDGDCCRGKRGESPKTPKTTTVLVLEKPCTFPKLDIIPRHCLSKKEYIDLLATPSRKCPPPCLRKPVVRKIRPISARINELALPTRQRITATLEERGATLPPEFVDNLIKVLEGEACLTPEQAAKYFREKRKCGSKKQKKDPRYKCKEKSKKKRSQHMNSLGLDEEAVKCQYLMAERFVKSILEWKCPIPKEEFKDIAEVILRRLSYSLNYMPVKEEDRKSQQMRLLADMVACWISGVLFEVSEVHKKELEEECERRRKEKEMETEESEEEEEDETDEDKEDKEDEEEEEEEEEEEKPKKDKKTVKDKEKEDKAKESAEKDAREAEEKRKEEEAKKKSKEMMETPVEEESEAEKKKSSDAGVADGETKQTEAEKEAEKEAEENKRKEEESKAAEAEEQKKAEEEEAEKKKKEEEEAAELQKQQEEAEKKKQEELEEEKKKEEAAEAEKKLQEDEEAAKKKQEEEEALKKQQEEEEAEKKKQEEEEAEKKKQEEEELEKKKQEEQKKQEEEAGDGSKEEEESEKKKREEEKARQEQLKAEQEKEEKKKKEIEDKLKDGPREALTTMDDISKIFKTELPFVTFGRILDVVDKILQEETQDSGDDPLANRIKYAIYEKFTKLIKAEDPKLLTENMKDVVNILAGKLSSWLVTTLTESQMYFMDKHPAEVESVEIRDWSSWINDTTSTANRWISWIRTTIREAQTMQDKKVTRSEWHDWTKSVETNALLWRRYYLQALHQANRNLTAFQGRNVVKTGQKGKLDYPEMELKTTNLEAD